MRLGVIWKFEVLPGKSTEMPQGARILTVAAQDDKLCVWADVDPAAPTVPRRLVGYATGARLGDDGTYVGTAHGVEPGEGWPGGLVIHIYDEGEGEE